MEEFSEGQSVEFKVEVVGSLTPFLLGFSSDPLVNQNPNMNRIPRRMAIMANGEFVSVATETGWGTGVFVGDLIIDLNQAGPDGIVELFGTMIAENYTITNAFGGVASFSPTIFSNTVKIKVTEPNLASDPQSAVNQTFNDLLGFNPSQAEVSNALTEDMNAEGYLFENQSFLNWAARLSNRDSFQNMVDSIGGYHIMTGQWPLTTKVEEILIPIRPRLITMLMVQEMLMGMDIRFCRRFVFKQMIRTQQVFHHLPLGLNRLWTKHSHRMILLICMVGCPC